MFELTEMTVRASEVRIGDRIVLSGRLVTQVQIQGGTVVMSHRVGETVADVDCPIRIEREVRIVDLDEPQVVLSLG